MQKFITELQTMTENKQKKILQYNAGFRIQTTSDCPITIIFRKRNTTEKEIFPYVFFHAKRKVREKTAAFRGNIASFWKKTASLPHKHLYEFKNTHTGKHKNITFHIRHQLPTEHLISSTAVQIALFPKTTS